MAITKLIVGGFKSIRERTEIPIAPLTFLFGPNSAGKSAVLAAVEELSKRLVETSGEEGAFARSLRSLRHFGKDSNAHQLPAGSEDAEPLHAPVNLGLELDSFPSGETRFDGRIDKGRSMALDLYKTLDGASVRLEFIDAGMRFWASVAVDGKDLVEFADAASFVVANPSNLESPPLGPLGKSCKT